MNDERRRQLFGSYGLKPASATVPPQELADLIERLGGVRAPGRSTATRHRYELMFSHMICDDVSNPEFLGKDEPYTVFSIITQAQADSGEPARSVTTPVFKVKEGDRAPATGSSNTRLFGRTGPATIDSDVLITAAHFEHDAGDLAEIAKDLATILTIAAGLAKGAKKDLASTVLGALALLTGILAGIAADDPVGNPASLLLTESDADAKTATTAQVVLPALKFDGGDPNGKIPRLPHPPPLLTPTEACAPRARRLFLGLHRVPVSESAEDANPSR